MAPYPQWLDIVAWTWMSLCFLSAAIILVNTMITPQKMWIMSVVWPVTGLYMGPVAVHMYRKSLPVSKKQEMGPQMKQIMERHKDDPPTWTQNSIAVFHCGAGCSLGDMAAESLCGALAISFAGEFGSKLVLDFVFAYVFGVAFQYFTIVPMRGLSFGKGLVAAVRADTVSIVLFQVGMYAWMALSYFVLFPHPHLHPGMAVFWFMMQIAMVVGFFTAIPANAWLIKKGWKEKMPKVDPNVMHAEMQSGPAMENRRRAA